MGDMNSIRSCASETLSTATNSVDIHSLDTHDLDDVEQLQQQGSLMTCASSLMSEVSRASVQTCTAAELLSSHQSTSSSQVSAPSRPRQTVVNDRTSTELAENTASRCSSTPSINCHHSDPAASCLTSSVSSPLFTSIEIPWREYPAELREPQYDAVVISTVDDARIAAVFKHILSAYIKLEVCFI